MARRTCTHTCMDRTRRCGNACQNVLVTQVSTLQALVRTGLKAFRVGEKHAIAPPKLHSPRESNVPPNMQSATVPLITIIPLCKIQNRSDIQELHNSKNQTRIVCGPQSGNLACPFKVEFPGSQIPANKCIILQAFCNIGVESGEKYIIMFVTLLSRPHHLHHHLPLHPP